MGSSLGAVPEKNQLFHYNNAWKNFNLVEMNETSMYEYEVW